MGIGGLGISQLSTLLIYAAMAAYAVAFVAFAVDLTGLAGSARRSEAPASRRGAGIAMAATWLGAVFHLGGVVLRGIAAGRVPWANSYEFTITFTLVAVAVFLVLARMRDIRYLGAFITGPALLLLGLATSVLFVAADGVQPALQSYWLAIHVALAAAATGLFSVACAYSVLQLAQDSRASRLAASRDLAPALAGAGGTSLAQAGATHGAAGRGSGGQAPAPARPWDPLLARLPGAQALERTAFRLNAVGFVLWTFTVIAGAIWAQHAWNRFWGWDPKEVFSLIAWLAYAVYLHARLTKGWQGRRAALISLVAYGIVLFNFFGVNFLFSGLHSYTGLT